MKAKINLLEETVHALKAQDLKIKDIAYIGTNPAIAGPHYACTWKEFSAMAQDVNYDNGWGSQEINSNLVILFKDGTFMERGEYDGSEWWQVVRPRLIPSKVQQLTKEMLYE